jgi:predicted nucleic acid-binding protein
MNDPLDTESLPAEALALLQRGMAQYRSDPVGAELLFGIARSQAPASLPLYRALVKFYNRECRFDAAYDMAALGMREATRLGKLPPDWRDWTPDLLAGPAASFALLTLKGMAFIELRRGNTAASVEILEQLRLLDPSDGIGSSVVAALAAGI